MLLESDLEYYAYDEPTPADDVVTTSDGSFIMRVGEPPIPVKDAAENEASNE